MAATNVQAFSGDVEISSNLAVDTNTLFVDSVGNKVGIGRTDPSTYLHLSAKNSNPGATEGDFIGTHDLTEYLRFTSMADVGDVNTVSVGFKLGADDNSDVGPDGRLDICANDGSSAGNDFGATPDRTIATFLGGGNVGIGTTSPGAPLEIYTPTTGNSSTLILKRDVSSYGGSDDGAAIEFKTRFTGNSGTYGQARIRGVDDNLGDSGEGGFAFDTLQDQVYYERMRIKHNGYVGIGTNGPGSKLDIRAGSSYVYIQGPNQGNSGGPNNDPWTGLVFTRIGTNGETYNGNVSLRTYRYGTSGQNPNMALTFNLSDTAPYNTRDVMTLYGNGRVGIGVTTPADGLHVNNGNLRFGNNTYYQNRVVYANSSAGGTVYFEFGQTWVGDDSQQLLIITAGGNPVYNTGNFGMVACQHKSYGTGISQTILYNFARQGSWTIGVSNSPTVGSGTYIYANGVNASRGFKCRMIILNIAA
jgi:hypothetical protein